MFGKVLLNQDITNLWTISMGYDDIKLIQHRGKIMGSFRKVPHHVLCRGFFPGSVNSISTYRNNSQLFFHIRTSIFSTHDRAIAKAIETNFESLVSALEITITGAFAPAIIPAIRPLAKYTADLPRKLPLCISGTTSISA